MTSPQRNSVSTSLADVDAASGILLSVELWSYGARHRCDTASSAHRGKLTTSELAVRMRRAVGFRNVLVDEYADLDDQIVLARLNGPSDLEQFSGQVAKWLGR
ncbi:MAG TPA: HepT-like ribonuclease domain-containing protein [Propionibacteriaceae bacterium]|nr:HepT-like ribonuclease domain-containing protein [Propionibacteriaceae bacterium]